MSKIKTILYLTLATIVLVALYVFLPILLESMAIVAADLLALYLLFFKLPSWYNQVKTAVFGYFTRLKGKREAEKLARINWQTNLASCKHWLLRLYWLLVDHKLGTERLRTAIADAAAWADELASDPGAEKRLSQLQLQVLQIKSQYRAWLTRHADQAKEPGLVQSLEKCLFHIGCSVDIRAFYHRSPAQPELKP